MENSPKINRIRSKYGKPYIDITDKEINEGIIADSRKCMIAEAVKNSLPDVKQVSVDLATIRFTDKKTGSRYTYMTPRAAQQALVQFDNGQKPEPFRIRLQTLFQIRPKPIIARRTPTQGIAAENTRTSEKLHGGISQSAPVKIGGQPMPRAALGYIRRFGLRTLPAGTPAGKMELPQSN